MGCMLMVLAVLQLFQFEDFPGLIAAMRLPGGAMVAWLVAALMPLLEIASLPYLFSMKVPAKLRLISMWCGVATGALWLALTLWTSLTQGMGLQSGIFGATLPANSGWWSVLFAALLLWSQLLTMRELPKRRER